MRGTRVKQLKRDFFAKYNRKPLGAGWIRKGVVWEIRLSEWRIWKRAYRVWRHRNC